MTIKIKPVKSNFNVTSHNPHDAYVQLSIGRITDYMAYHEINSPDELGQLMVELEEAGMKCWHWYSYD